MPRTTPGRPTSTLEAGSPTPLHPGTPAPHTTGGSAAKAIDLRDPSTSAADDMSDYQLRRIVERSRRQTGLSLPLGFVRDTRGSNPPLAQLLRGGRGGEVRLKLYLTMALLATKKPYEIRPIAGRTWASALGLPEPETRGERRIADAITWLADKQHPMVKVTRVPGSPPTVRLLNALGTGRQWDRATTPFVRVPLAYWTERWIWKLTGAATAVLIIIMDEQSKRTHLAKRGAKAGSSIEPVAASFSGVERRFRGLSDDTWARAVAELSHKGLIDIGRVTRGGEELDWRRERNSYAVREDTFTGMQELIDFDVLGKAEPELIL